MTTAKTVSAYQRGRCRDINAILDNENEDILDQAKKWIPHYVIWHP